MEQQQEIQAQFLRKQKEYIAEKKARKEEMLRLRKEQFGQSSSDQDDDIEKQQKNEPKIQQNIKKSSFKEVVDKTELKINEKMIKIFSKKQKKWQSLQTSITDKSINIRQQIQFKSLSSIEIITSAKQSQHQFLVNISLLVNNSKQQITLGIPNELQQFELPFQYYLFAKIIQERAKLLQIPITEDMKVPENPPQKIILNSDIYGYLQKKSQFLGKWDQRFIVINKAGLFSYRDIHSQPTMLIPWQTVNSISTAFLMHNQAIVITLHYGRDQTSFAIPITNFIDKNIKKNWLYQIYRRSVKYI